MRRGAVFLACLAAIVSLGGPALAIVGEAGPADVALQRQTILVFSAKGRCSGVLLAQDLVLTAAHCVEFAGEKYSVGGLVGEASRVSVKEIARHPDFRKSDADIALVRLEKPLPAQFASAYLQGRPLREGNRVIVGGYGLGVAGKAEATATLRSAGLVVSAVWRGRATLKDVNHGDPESKRLGPCSGDSGGPVFTYRGLLSLVGIMTAGDCKGTASIITVSHYYGWIVETAAQLGSPLN